MTRFILRWVINAIALYVAVLIVPGIEFRGDWVGVLWLALISGLLNALVRPILKFLTCPLIILTLGFFTIFINTALLLLTTRIGQALNIGITVDGFWSALLGSLVISIVSIVLSLFLRDELKKK